MYKNVKLSYFRSTGCNDAVSFCGLRDKNYPDKRKMGFPFDRVYAIETLADFANQYSNMNIDIVTIKFENTVLLPYSNL